MVSPRRQSRDRPSTIAGHAVSGTRDPGVAGICTLVTAAYPREAGRVAKPVNVLNNMEVAAEGVTDDEQAGHTQATIPDRLGGVEPDPNVGAAAGEPAHESGLKDEARFAAPHFSAMVRSRGRSPGRWPRIRWPS